MRTLWIEAFISWVSFCVNLPGAELGCCREFFSCRSLSIWRSHCTCVTWHKWNIILPGEIISNFLHGFRLVFERAVATLIDFALSGWICVQHGYEEVSGLSLDLFTGKLFQVVVTIQAAAACCTDVHWCTMWLGKVTWKRQNFPLWRSVPG